MARDVGGIVFIAWAQQDARDLILSYSVYNDFCFGTPLREHLVLVAIIQLA